MFNISIHQGNANSNYFEISSQPSQNEYFQEKKLKNSDEDVERKETLYIPSGMKSVWIQWKSM